MTEPMIRPTTFQVSFLPEGHRQYREYVVTIEYAGNGFWVVRRHRSRLSRTGEWWFESALAAADEALVEGEHSRFNLTTATELATAAAREVRVQGCTAEEVLAAGVQHA